VDFAHEAGVIHDFHFNVASDHRATTYVIKTKLDLGEMEATFGEASIEFFYKNIGHIARGDWWLYSTPDTREEYDEKVSGIFKKEYLPGDERTWSLGAYLLQIGTVLCFDIHGQVESRNEGVVTSEAIEAFSVLTLVSSWRVQRCQLNISWIFTTIEESQIKTEKVNRNLPRPW